MFQPNASDVQFEELELVSEEQLTGPSTRRLFSWWKARSRLNLPRLSELDLSELKDIFDHVFVFEREASGSFRCIVSGEEAANFFGEDRFNYVLRAQDSRGYYRKVAQTRLSRLCRGSVGLERASDCFESIACPCTNAAGGVSHIIGVIEMIGGSAAERLAQSDQLLRSVLDHCSIGVTIVAKAGPNVGQRLYQNRRHIELLGAQNEAETRSMPPGKSYQRLEDYELLLKLLAKHGYVRGFEAERRRLDGSTWWCLTDFQPIWFKNTPCDIGWVLDTTDRKLAERERDQQRLLLQSIMNSVEGAIFVTDKDARLVLANSAFTTLLKMEKPCLGQTAAELFDGPFGQYCLELDTEVLRTGKAVLGIQFHWPHAKSGFWVAHKSPILDENGDCQGVVTVVSDIDRVSEMLVDATIGFIQFDARGRFLMANRKLHDLFPAIRIELQKNFSYASYLHSIKADFLESEHAKLDVLISRTDIFSSLAREPVVFHCRDGRWLQLQERTNVDGGVISTWMDISAQIRSGAELASLRGQLFAAIRNMSEGFALFGSDGSLVVCNDQYRALMGARSPFGVRYDSILETGLAEDHFNLGGRDRRAWKADMTASHRNSREVEVSLKSGRWLRIASRPTDDGGMISIVHDITERKRTELAVQAAKEAAEASNRAKSEFLANMSHELRTPLNAIIGFADVLSNERLGPLGGTASYLEYGQYILQSGHHLLGIINTILDLSKIEAGHFELVEEPIKVSELVNACRQIILGRAIDGQIQLEFDIDPQLPSLIADATSMKQSLLNLLSNAVKFTSPGGRVSTSARLTEKGELAISVKDTGIGIAEMDIARIVQPFGQVERSFNKKHEGIGLGLALTKKLIERHGGQLQLTSKLGVGTTATLILSPKRLRRI